MTDDKSKKGARADKSVPTSRARVAPSSTSKAKTPRGQGKSKTTEKLSTQQAKDIGDQILSAASAQQGKKGERKERPPYEQPKQPEAKRGPGHPPHPDKWTPEYVAQVAGWMHEYVGKTAMPMICEFCFLYGIQQQRFSEHPELSYEREMLNAKAAIFYAKEGVRLEPGEGPRGAFIAKLAANTGGFSITDKSVVVTADAPDDITKMSPEEREARLKEILAKVGA